MLKNQMFHVEHSPFGLYIHVPFCVSKCGYCDFCRVTDFSLVDGYLATLEYEMHESIFRGLTPTTLYIGGGTPSSLGCSRLERLLKMITDIFDLSKVDEFTVECNPDDVSSDMVSVLKNFGVNRVSMGVQSLYDEILKFMGRRHNAEQVYVAINNLRKGGINNISVDCIYGLPRLKTDYSAETDFAKFIDLGVEHLSAYALSYEEGSRFSQLVDDGKLEPLSDDEVADQYVLLIDMMRRAGYEHYEISNFALPSRRALHNSSYWCRTNYVGFGPAASSLVSGVRSTNTYDVKEYISTNSEAKTLVETLTEKDIYEEEVMLRLRTMDGLQEQNLPEKFRTRFTEVAIRENEWENVEQLPNGNWRIKEERWFVSNSIIERFFF